MILNVSHSKYRTHPCVSSTFYRYTCHSSHRTYNPRWSSRHTWGILPMPMSPYQRHESSTSTSLSKLRSSKLRVTKGGPDATRVSCVATTRLAVCLTSHRGNTSVHLWYWSRRPVQNPNSNTVSPPGSSRLSYQYRHLKQSHSLSNTFVRISMFRNRSNARRAREYRGGMPKLTSRHKHPASLD